MICTFLYEEPKGICVAQTRTVILTELNSHRFPRCPSALNFQGRRSQPKGYENCKFAQGRKLP
eukprot:251495-Amphidinium_carterae.1